MQLLQAIESAESSGGIQAGMRAFRKSEAQNLLTAMDKLDAASGVPFPAAVRGYVEGLLAGGEAEAVVWHPNQVA